MAERTEWKNIDTLPYDEGVMIGWTDGSVSQDFLYDQTLEEWKSERWRKPFHDGDPVVVPYCWISLPPMPEPVEYGEGQSDG